MTVPYSFGSATSAIPLSQLDSNFNTPITLGNTAIQLGNTVTTLNNMTLANVTVSSGTITLTDITASGNVTLSGGTANGVAYLNGSKVVTTGSALTFDGTNLKVAGETSITGGSQSTLNALHLYFDTGTNTSFIKSYHSGVDDRDLTIGARNIAFQVPNGTEIGRFTSTGLGIGTSSPSSKLTLNTASGENTLTYALAGSVKAYIGVSAGAGQIIDNSAANDYCIRSAANILFAPNGQYEKMRLDTSGNLGLGVTPSAWGSPLGSAFLEAKNGMHFGSISTTVSIGYIGVNSYYNGTNWIYKNSTYSNRYELNSSNTGAHAWFTAPSGTAGNAITFTQAMTLDASGNLGIGSTSPSNRLDVRLSLSATANPQWVADFWASTSGNTDGTYGGGIRLYTKCANGNYWPAAIAAINDASGSNASSLGFYTAPSSGTLTERARIDSSGNLLVGTTSVPGGGGKITVSGDNSSGRMMQLIGTTGTDTTSFSMSITKNANDSTTSQRFIGFLINAGATGSGQINANGASQAAFGSFSDQRLKENISDLTPQLSKLMALRPVEFDYKDGSGHQTGFIAQEMQQIFPDAVGDDGSEDKYLTITGWNKTEAILVKAIQEQQTIIETLTARITALEGQ